MKKSLVIFFAVIAAASALRLPVDLKVAVGKIQEARQKDVRYESEAMADAIPEGAYESEAMADAIPEGTYESESMADAIPEGTYESESMADAIPEGTYESDAMGEDAPRPPVILERVAQKIESIRHQDEEYESEHMADTVPEELPQEEVQAYESVNMADPAYETKAMADTPYETIAVKDEYENQAMADEIETDAEEQVEAVASPVESVVMADESPEPRRFGADGVFVKFETKRFSADGADEVNTIAEGVYEALRRFAADGAEELQRRFHADGKAIIEPRVFPARRFPAIRYNRAETN